RFPRTDSGAKAEETSGRPGADRPRSSSGAPGAAPSRGAFAPTSGTRRGSAPRTGRRRSAEFVSQPGPSFGADPRDPVGVQDLLDLPVSARQNRLDLFLERVFAAAHTDGDVEHERQERE